MSKRTNKPGFVYLFRNPANRLFKIGESKAPCVRALAVADEVGVRLETVHLIWADVCARRLEEVLHDHFGLKRMRGEWFKLDGDDVRQFQGWGTAEDVAASLGRTRRRKLNLFVTHDLANRVTCHARRLRMTTPQLARFALSRFLDLLEAETPEGGGDEQ